MFRPKINAMDAERAAVSEIREQILSELHALGDNELLMCITLMFLDEEPSLLEMTEIKYNDKLIRIKNTVAANWTEFAIALRLDKGNNLDALNDQCFRDPFKMTNKLCDLYLANNRELDPPIQPSWRELLEALRVIRQGELVRKLNEYFSYEALRRAVKVQQPERAVEADSAPDYMS